jgi:glycosyltransferase involved in cell wall biosynthesis
MLTPFGTRLKLDSAFSSLPKTIATIAAEDSLLEETLITSAGALNERLNCLVVCLSHAWGGLEQVAVHDALDLFSLGLKVQVLCLQDSPVHAQLLTRGHGKVSLLPLSFSPKNYLDWVIRGELHRLLGEGVNLIHTHQTSLLGSIVPWLWGRSDVALVATRHIMNDHNKKDFFHRALYRRLDSLMVVSEAVRRNILETHPLRGSRVKVVHLGLDFRLFEPSVLESKDIARQRMAWGADAQTIVVGLVGRIDPAKGQSTFIKAAAGLLKSLKQNEKLKFVIIGEETAFSDKNHLNELKQMVVQFHLEDQVVFAGYHANIPEVMRSLDIFTMPSRQEAFGLVAIEAMAMECPVIISRGGSAEEIVGGREEFGLLTRPDDAFDLQRQIRILLDNPQERVEMGRRARAHVKFHYDRRKRVINTLNLYQRALRRRQGFL